MKVTFRTSVFETNSSSAHTFIHVSKETFEAWVRGQKALVTDGSGMGGGSYDEDDFRDTDAVLKPQEKENTYADLLDFYSKLKPGLALKDDPDRDFIDPSRWSGAADDEGFTEEDFFERKPSIEIKDDGETVEVSIWGNDH